MKRRASAPGERSIFKPAACLFPILAAVALSSTSAAPASAMTKDEFVAAIQPVSDVEGNQRLEREFSALVEKDDEAGVKALASRIRSESGPALDEFETLAQQLNADTTQPPVGPARDIALSLGPCHYAGLTLRLLVTSAASGDAKPVFRKDTVMIDDNAIDTLFARHMDSCETLRDKLSPARLIGNRCLTTGAGCDDDPDFAETNTTP